MGCFDYICIVKGKKCLTPNGGQHVVDDGTCYVTNKSAKLALECCYIGYGYAELDDMKIWDISMSESFEYWDIEPEDKKAYFVCQNCVKKIKKCKSFDELYKPKTKKEIIEDKINIINKDIDLSIERRNIINKYIRKLKSQLKSLNNQLEIVSE